MIYVTAELMGGLGNQLFQIATAYAYSRKYDCELVFVIDWDCPPDRPPVWQGYLDSSIWRTCSRGTYHALPWRLVSEKGFAYLPLKTPTQVNQTGFIRLYGYFQSSKYFSEYTANLRQLLKPRIEMILAAKAKLYGFSGYVGAHVRRGDYVKAAPYHLVCGPTYYKGARNVIEKKISGPVWWVTDDPNWVHETLARPGDMVVSGNSIEDFVLLTQFKHLILSNSSYSWWAAWLNPEEYSDRIICCPNKWFGQTGPTDYESVFEPEWMRIDTTSGNLVAQL